MESSDKKIGISKGGTAYVLGCLVIRFQRRTSKRKINDFLTTNGLTLLRCLPSGTHIVGVPEGGEEELSIKLWKNPIVYFVALNGNVR